MEAIGNGEGSQVLRAHALWTKAARRGKRQLGPLSRSGSTHFQRRRRVMKQLSNWFRRKRLETNLDQELQYHLQRRIADFERSGLSAAEARRQARLELGGVAQIQEEVRDIWLTRWLRDFIYDLRFSVRSFLRTPAFTMTAVLSLTLGIGATTAIYSLVDQVLLHALPVRQPERLVLF